VVRFDFDTLGACLGLGRLYCIECAAWHKLSFKLQWRQVGRLHDYVPFSVPSLDVSLFILVLGLGCGSWFWSFHLAFRCRLRRFVSFGLFAGPSWLCKSAKTRRNTSYLAGPIDRCHLEWFTVNWGCCLQWNFFYTSLRGLLPLWFMFIFIYGTFRSSSSIFCITYCAESY